jgi:hypothetical protein
VAVSGAVALVASRSITALNAVYTLSHGLNNGSVTLNSPALARFSTGHDQVFIVHRHPW